MSDYRIIDPPGLAGTRTLLVDGQGNADYNTIQAAIDAAAAVATINERWQVRVAPGVYAENLVMADYVDLVGLAPGRAALIKPASGVALVGNVDATLARAESLYAAWGDLADGERSFLVDNGVRPEALESLRRDGRNELTRSFPLLEAAVPGEGEAPAAATVGLGQPPLGAELPGR